MLAITSRGDALVLAALLVVAALRPLAVGAVAPALLAASWRWGSTSLEGLAGAQAVLGPAGAVGTARQAAATWLAAGAILLAVAWPRPRGVPASSGERSARPIAAWAPSLLVAIASGTAIAAVVAGPAPGGDVWIRVVAALIATVLALAVAQARGRGGRLPSVLDVVALVAGVGALVLVGPEAPAWSGTIDARAVETGLLTALAVGMSTGVGVRAVAAMGQRDP